MGPIDGASLWMLSVYSYFKIFLRKIVGGFRIRGGESRRVYWGHSKLVTAVTCE